MSAFIDIGIILLLFMAGMEVDIKGMIKRWQLVLINGAGQITLLLIVSMGLESLTLALVRTPSVMVGLPLSSILLSV